MFSSIRSRLWLSYALVIVAALFLTAVILALYLLQSPLAYRSTFQDLDAARTVLVTSQPDLSSLSGVELTNILSKYDQTLGVRLLILGRGRQVLADSRSGAAPAIIPPRRYQLLRSSISLRDENGQNWLYLAESFSNGRILILLTPRPHLPLLSFLRNELFLPFIYAGGLALVLSLFVAFALARWIGSPLQSLVSASRRIPDTSPLPLRGPHEVQELTGAFNEMSRRVDATQKAHQVFVADVSHELNTPLTSIQGFAQALQDGTADTPEARLQAAGIIQAEADRMHRMVLDLLDLARMDSGTLVLEFSQVDLPQLLQSISEKFALQTKAAGVTIRIETASMPPIPGDGDRLAQVFTNLVDNALRFTPAGGNITLRTQVTGPVVQVEVEDNGTGIPPEAIPHIFERFFQVDPSRPGGRKHGAGLGLSIVKDIITAHDGKISVRSTPGNGSIFIVTLPLIRQAASPVGSKRNR